MDEHADAPVAGVVEVTYRRTPADARAVVAGMRRSRPGVLLRLLALPLVVLLAAALPFAPATRGSLLFIGVLTLLMLVLSPYIGPRLSPARWGVGLVHHVVLTPEGMRQDFVTDTALAWAGIDQFTVTRSAVFGLRGDRVQFALPRRRVADADVARAREWWTAARATAPADSTTTHVAVPLATPAPAGAPDAVRGPSAGPGDEVTERSDGTLQVTGRLTPARARAVASGVRPAVLPRALVLLLLTGLVAAVGGEAGVVALGGVLALVVVALWASTPALVARRLLRSAGTAPVTWTYSREGLGIEIAGARTALPWSRTRDTRVRGDMLVVRTQGVRAAAGGLVDPLTDQQRERVLAWAAAGRGRARPETRRAG